MNSAWRTIRLGAVCTKIGSGATPRGGSDVYVDKGPVALIRSQNIYNDGFARIGLAYITEKQVSDLDNVHVEKEDVLLNITGDSVARCTQVDGSVLPARVNQHVAIIRPNKDQLDPLFLRYYLISPLIQQHLFQLASAGATRPALTKAMIESLLIYSPSKASVQQGIGRFLGTFDDKIELNRKDECHPRSHGSSTVHVVVC